MSELSEFMDNLLRRIKADPQAFEKIEAWCSDRQKFVTEQKEGTSYMSPISSKQDYETTNVAEVEPVHSGSNQQSSPPMDEDKKRGLTPEVVDAIVQRMVESVRPAYPYVSVADLTDSASKALLNVLLTGVASNLVNINKNSE